ncbi:MAG: peptide MFS transporter, partial [Candidatus Eremiobacteraeota bacterium]|nr:peptide MFS transporter [Candidatus Eremiobacteraeota bacterium]
DRLIGSRPAVIIGGALMAAGHLLMGVETPLAFYTALALLIAGNGFFKPNISTVVGSLYSAESTRRDSGFTIFYMGINLGAAMSPLICGYVGETYGWHYGFGLATIGMLIGLAVFVAPTVVCQMMILGGALATGISLFFLQNNPYQLAINALIAVALIVAGVIAFIALARGGLPAEAGQPPDPDAPNRPVFGIPAQIVIYVGVVIAIPVIALLLQNQPIVKTGLSLFGLVCFGWLLFQAFGCEKVERERLFVVLILMFFSMLFWAFFEQAGSSISNFTDRNVDRVTEERTVTEADVGKTITIEPNQEQLGYKLNDKVFVLTDLDEIRKGENKTIEWPITEDNVGMGIGGSELPASLFQAANPTFILIFGLVFSALWTFLGQKGIEPSTPVKFALGLLQLGLGFGALWYGAQHADARGMVTVSWLLLAYLLHTTGELCLSPVGLSMVTKLSPKAIVSTVMGAWFLATAFSNLLAGMIATFTGVSEGAEAATIPPPIETLGVYGHVFGIIAACGMGSAVFCLLISKLLTNWMHMGEQEDEV